jgi:hypothetical protein
MHPLSMPLTLFRPHERCGSLTTVLQPPPSNLNVELSYADDFDEECMVGTGGFGTVFKAINKLDKRPCVTSHSIFFHGHSFETPKNEKNTNWTLAWSFDVTPSARANRRGASLLKQWPGAGVALGGTPLRRSPTPSNPPEHQAHF